MCVSCIYEGGAARRRLSSCSCFAATGGAIVANVVRTRSLSLLFELKKEENDVLISLCVYSIAKRSFAMVYTPLRVLPYISGVAAYSPPMPPAHGSACHFFIARLSLTDNLFARISRP